MKQTLVLRIFVDSLGLYLYLTMLKLVLLQPFLLIMFIYKCVHESANIEFR